MFPGCDVISGFTYYMFWIISFYGAVKGETACGTAMKQYSLLGASLCYNTSAIGNRVVLDGFLTQQSQETNCKCVVTSTEKAKVSFTVLNNLQPDHSFCGSTITIETAGSSIPMNCFVDGNLNIQPSQTMDINFNKPAYSFDSNYCMLLTPDSTSALLTLKCEGDLPGSSETTSKKATTTSQTITVISTEKPTTTSTAIPTTSTIFKTTTSQRSTHSSRATTTETQRTTRAPTEQSTTRSQTSTHSTTRSQTSPHSTTRSQTSTHSTTRSQTSTHSTTRSQTSTHSTTRSQTSTHSTTRSQTSTHSTTRSQTSTHSTLQSTVTGTTGSDVTPKELSVSTTEWIYIIPVIGVGLILICAIVVAICYTQRNKHKNLHTQRNGMYAFENKPSNSPYSPDFNAGSGMISKLSTSIESSDIKVVVVDDVRDDVSESTNVSEGTFVRHSVRQPIIKNEVPTYAVVNKSTMLDKPGSDAKYAVFDKSTTQENQLAEMEADIIY